LAFFNLSELQPYFQLFRSVCESCGELCIIFLWLNGSWHHQCAQGMVNYIN